MANINTQNVSEAEEALKLAYTDLIAFGKLFLPDDFLRSETPFFHYEVADAIGKFNETHFKDEDLKVSNLILNETTHLSMITQFPGAKSSLMYYEKFILDPEIASELPIQEMEVFSITKDNFTIFYQTKELEGYLTFFKTHY